MCKKAEMTLCWSCKRACGGVNGCSWSNNLIPVKGWTAIPTKKSELKSFLVTECPLYVKGRR